MNQSTQSLGKRIRRELGRLSSVEQQIAALLQEKYSCEEHIALLRQAYAESSRAAFLQEKERKAEQSAQEKKELDKLLKAKGISPGQLLKLLKAA